MKQGDVVISHKGRYDGEYFFVVEAGEGFALLCDGKRRRIDRPKKKNVRHLEETSFFSAAVAERLDNGGNAVDALMRAELKRLKLMLPQQPL